MGTGHQAWLWHPGILAKDIAASLYAAQHDADVFHLVVDHDPVESFKLDLPLKEGDRLESVSVALAPVNPDVPPCAQAALPRVRLEQGLREIKVRFGRHLACGLNQLESAITGAVDTPTLGEQVAQITASLLRPYAGHIPMRLSSMLSHEERFASLVQQMLRDARACIGHYNREVAAHPAARVSPLIESIDRVELPLWAIAWGQPRRRVFADLSDGVPALALENGDALDPAKGAYTLAPRALLMTAYLRSGACDLFIHGKGGGEYDRITEQWWREWTGQELAPMAVVSADVRMDFQAPVADPKAVEHAVWLCHHLPHNIERELDGDAPAVDHIAAERKQELLSLMKQDRDGRKRAAMFREIHAINQGLVSRHPRLIEAAQGDLERARVGVANSVVARRRDWCFALYPPSMLNDLRDHLARALQSKA